MNAWTKKYLYRLRFTFNLHHWKIYMEIGKHLFVYLVQLKILVLKKIEAFSNGISQTEKKFYFFIAVRKK